MKISVVTLHPDPDPTIQEQWCFPDTEAGILEAISKGATHIWANTVLFASHPLQTSPKLNEYASKIHIIGQPPVLTEICDDKDYLNNFIRSKIDVPMPRSWLINETQDLKEFIRQNALPWPIVAKPVRGRASQGVKVCGDEESLFQHLREIFPNSPSVILEEFLGGEEATVAVMPPDIDHEDYWTLPPVIRYNHMDNVVPYTGDVLATSNSRAVTAKDMKLPKGHGYLKVSDDCKKVAKLLEVSSLIRIDVRRYSTDTRSEFALFDINMKPVSTHPTQTISSSQDSSESPEVFLIIKTGYNNQEAS